MQTVNSPRDDVLDLFDHVWQRFRTRMTGLGDDEWRWEPTDDARLTLRWRLSHVTDLLVEDRNGPWLGLASPPDDTPEGPAGAVTAGDARSALAAAEAAYARWRGQLAATTDAVLAAPIGAVAGPYGGSTRRSFALHIADELIHHTAEAALLRDLYAARGGSQEAAGG